MSNSKKIAIGLMMLMLVVNVINISPLGTPPGWNGTEPSSIITLYENL